MLIAPTIMRTPNDRVELATRVLEFAKYVADVKAEAAYEKAEQAICCRFNVPQSQKSLVVERVFG